MPSEASIRRRAEHLCELVGAAEPSDDDVRRECRAELDELRCLWQKSPRLFAADTLAMLRRIAASLGGRAMRSSSTSDSPAATRRPEAPASHCGVAPGLADRQGVAAFVVFSDATLVEMARRRPRTLEELALVSGVGPKKLASYGEAFLRVLSE